MTKEQLMDELTKLQLRQKDIINELADEEYDRLVEFKAEFRQLLDKYPGVKLLKDNCGLQAYVQLPMNNLSPYVKLYNL